MVPDVLWFDGPSARLREPRVNEASTYAYGTDHAIIRGRYGRAASGGRAPSRVQVVGTGVLADAFDWTRIDFLTDHLEQRRDGGLTSGGQAGDRAAALLRKEGALAAHSEVLAPVNCGQELYDLVSVTEPRAGLNGAVRRVAGWRIVYERHRRGRYEQTLALSDA
jgi:hypothetical protein